jgi:hypothetical protein
LVESNKLDYSIGIAPRKYPSKIGGWGTSLVTALELDSYRGAGERGWQRDEVQGEISTDSPCRFLLAGKRDGELPPLRERVFGQMALASTAANRSMHSSSLAEGQD